ncbi:MAG TPA: hypothetical protein VHU81_18490 [Thermoanaerobaculia bacterium]|nr:hypothetical protein [Thermoanaerobaculia bacterium]
MKKRIWGCVLAASLAASSAGAVEFFVPVPHLGGTFLYRSEFAREDLAKINVSFTYVQEGRSGIGLTPSQFKVLPGPSTDATHPLLTDNYSRDFVRAPGRSDPKFYLPGGGLVRMEGERGLVGIETAVVVGGEPTAGWELPMLTAEDAFAAGRTAYVLNLLRDATTSTSSQLSIYNLGTTAAQCQTKLRGPGGQLLDERNGLAVPAVGAVRLADIVSKSVVGTTTGLSVAVSCDRPFYALGSYPAKVQSDIRVHYPSTTPPTQGTREILVNNESFRVTRSESEKRFTLPLPEGVRYRSVVMDFDIAVTAPQNEAYFRSIVGMWRPEPTRRFKKTLYFGTVERFDRSKLMADLGTPFIEILIKRANAPLRAGKTYHFHIEVDADQKILREIVTNASGGVVADLMSGLFNDDLMTRSGNQMIIGLGLPGIADGAYSPPYGWRFSKIVISAYR